MVPTTKQEVLTYMEYKGIKVIEAKGENYQLGMTPKSMLVWDGISREPNIRKVVGFVNGLWLAVACKNGGGTYNWEHAAEIPTAATTTIYGVEFEQNGKTIRRYFDSIERAKEEYQFVTSNIVDECTVTEYECKVVNQD